MPRILWPLFFSDTVYKSFQLETAGVFRTAFTPVVQFWSSLAFF